MLSVGENGKACDGRIWRDWQCARFHNTCTLDSDWYRTACICKYIGTTLIAQSKAIWCYTSQRPTSLLFLVNISITIIIFIIAQQCRILSRPQVLFQSSITLRIYVTPATKKGEEDGEKNERVGSGPDDKGDPDTEVVYVEDLWMKLGDARQHCDRGDRRGETYLRACPS